MGAVLCVVLLSALLKDGAGTGGSRMDVSEISGHQTSPVCGSSFYSKDMDDAVGVDMKFLLQVVSCVEWKSMTVISDGTPEMAGTVFTKYLPSDVVRMVFQLENTSDFKDWFKGIMSAKLLSTNFVVLGNSTFLRRVFSEVDETAKILLHWLTVMPRVDVSSFLEVTQHFDHVAIVIDDPNGQLTLETIVRRGDLTALSFVAQLRPFKDCSLPNLKNDAVFPNVKYGLSGRTLKIVTKPASPFVIRHRNNGSSWYTGLCIDLLEVLSATINFTYTIVESTDGYYGTRLPNGTWVGMIGMLHRKEVDFALASTSVTADRNAVADYTTGFYFDKVVMIARWPDPMPLSWTFHIRPFHWHVYVLMGSCLVFMTVVLVCVERLFARIYNRGQDGAVRRKSVTEAAEALFGAFIARAVMYEGVSNSSRLLLSSWLLLSVVTVASYTGKLISNSVVVQKPLPFNTLAELVQRTDYKWGFDRNTMLETIFAESTDPSYKQFYQKMLRFAEDDPDVTPQDVDTTLRRVLAGQYVYLGSYGIHQKLSREHCEVTIGKERLFQDTLAIYLQKKSPYLDKFNEVETKMLYTDKFKEVLGRATESGFLEYLARKWLPEKSTCKAEGEETTVAPVTVEVMQSAFVLALAGLVLAFVFLVLERLSKCKKAS